MRGFDLTPLFRSSIGFDRMRDLMEATQRMSDAPAYPPYNIEKLGENAYRITMAVAGFGENDLTIVAQDNSLVIAGKVEREESADEPKFLHRGIAGRTFERRFELAEHIRVNGASLENGLLHVDLVREVPEAMKPRQIKIAADTGAGKQRVIDQKAA
ncbi:MAG: Hsp20 family protein [Rhodospirillaceae bacterium]|nr:Hsp20 family protein [Rhodospirillaceae bacterium]